MPGPPTQLDADPLGNILSVDQVSNEFDAHSGNVLDVDEED